MFKQRLVEMAGSNGTKVFLSPESFQDRLERGVSVTDALNRATIEHGCYDETWVNGMPLDEVTCGALSPYGHRPSLSDQLLKSIPFSRSFVDCLEPGSMDWQTIYDTLTESYSGTQPLATAKNASCYVHDHILGEDCPRYGCHMFRCAPKPSMARVSISLPAWLLSMLPADYPRWLSAVICLGTMVKGIRVRAPYAVTELPTKRAKRQKSFMLWRERVQIAIPEVVHQRVLVWMKDVRTSSVDDAYATAVMLGLGLPGALDGYLNSPIEWHPVWNRLASSLNGHKLTPEHQQLLISRRHIDLIESIVGLAFINMSQTDYERQVYRRSRSMVVERLFEVLYRLPRVRSGIYWDKSSSDGQGQWRLCEPEVIAPSQVDRVKFCKAIIMSGLCAQRDRSWIELALDPVKVGGTGNYDNWFLDHYVDETALPWFIYLTDVFAERYRTMQVQRFVYNAYERHQSDDTVSASGYVRWLDRYGGACKSLDELLERRRAKASGELFEVRQGEVADELSS